MSRKTNNLRRRLQIVCEFATKRSNSPERITNLKRLREWNENPRTRNPIVMEWFFGHFFGLLDADKIASATEHYESLIKFTEIAEQLDQAQAKYRCNTNLKYYAGYSADWHLRFDNFLRRLESSNQQ